jgi:hypothetical protein
MLPGTWKLVAVNLGRSVISSVSIPDNVTFEIPGPLPVMIHIEAPDRVVAGQALVFRVIVDQYPKDLSPQCALTLQGSLHQAPANGQGGFGVAVSALDLKPDQRSYEMSGSFDADLPAGEWRGDVDIYAHGVPPSFRRFCRTPPIDGVKQFSFTLERGSGLVTPTSAVVTVNPSQVELLVGEADRLRAKAESLRGQLSSGPAQINQGLLLSSVQVALTDVDQTEAKFKDKGDSPSERAVDAFFDDIRYEYGEAFKVLGGTSAQVPVARARIDRVSMAAGANALPLNRVSEAVLASIVHNEKMYEVAASTKLLTFTLVVYTKPTGATISYKLRGEDYRPVDHETDWQIENLPRAVYLIRLQKQGYEDKEVTFDAIDSTNNSISERLVAKRGAR